MQRNRDKEIVIREALPSDAEAIAILLTQLRYPRDETFVKKKLAEFQIYPSISVLVAECDGIIAGGVSFDSQPLFHQEGRIGTITSLSVLEYHRGMGIGKKLVRRIEEIAAECGCIKIAVASGVHRSDAHRFYRELGYEENTKRFVKQLSAVIT